MNPNSRSTANLRRSSNWIDGVKHRRRRPEELDRLARCVVRRVIRRRRAETPFARRVLAEVQRHLSQCDRSAVDTERIAELVASRICDGLFVPQEAAGPPTTTLHETFQAGHHATEVFQMMPE